MPNFSLKSLIIRHERPEDVRAVEELLRDAFWDIYRPGCDEHVLMHLLRTKAEYCPELSFVAEYENAVCGVIASTRASITHPDGGQTSVITYGPLGVSPAFQRRGIGAALLKHAEETLRAAGEKAVVIYGSPLYYERFGFEPAHNYQLAAADGSFIDALQILVLDPSATFSGRFFEGGVFYIEPAVSEAYDRNFPPREKHVCATQLFKA